MLVPVTLVDDALAGVATVGGGVGAGEWSTERGPIATVRVLPRGKEYVGTLRAGRGRADPNEAVRPVWKLWFKRAVTSTASVQPIFRLEPAMLTVRPVPPDDCSR